MPVNEREINLGYDLNDYAWMDEINQEHGVVMIAAGVFYYFKREDAFNLFKEMAKKFPCSSLAFDTSNKKGLKMMLKTWIKEAGIKDVGTYFGLSKLQKESNAENVPYKSVTVKSYMHGYRKLKYRFIHKLCNILMDKVVKGRIIKIDF